MKNEYIPFPSEVKEIIRHTDIEYTFRMSYSGNVLPGQFFEVSIPKYGEAPISVSGIGEGTVDLTIRKVGKVTNQIFENYVGNTLLVRIHPQITRKVFWNYIRRFVRASLWQWTVRKA